MSPGHVNPNSGAESSPPAPDDSFAQILRDHRRQARQALQAQQDRIARLEGDLLAQVQEFASQLDLARLELDHRESEQSRTARELEARAHEVARCEAAIQAQQSEWNRRREDSESAWDELLSQLNAQLRDVADCRQELKREQDRLRQWETRLNATAASPPGTAEAQPSQKKTAAKKKPAAPPPATPAGPLDWESLKRQLLSQMEEDSRLESEDEDEIAAAESERIEISQIIAQTDALLQDKDRQIAELEALLHGQSANLGAVAVGAAAIAEMLDHDELVRQEREELQRLQADWHDKLRKAELEISIERAKIARERMALEEKLREQERTSLRATLDSKEAGGTGNQKGRWLARLGLLDQEKK